MQAQLLPPAQQSPVERPVADCRIYERASCALPSTCQPASALEMKEMRWAATIVDISQGGVRILLQRRFEKGTGLAVELPGDDQRESTVVFVRVVHLRADGNGTWALGCRFVSELSEDEIRRLLTATNHVLSSSQEDYDDETEDEIYKPPTETPPTEIAPLANVHLLLETQAGTLVDCMIRRLNVARSWPLTPGKVLKLNGKTKNQTAWSLRVKVVECARQAEGWEIHGRIVGPSTASQILKTLGSQPTRG